MKETTLFKASFSIVCAGLLASSAYGATPASDRASNTPYQPGNQWADASNGGVGFGPWTFSVAGSGGRFIGGTGEGETPSFGLFAPVSADLSLATRTFNGALVSGQTFSLDLGSTAVGTGGVVGLNLLSGAATVFTFKFAEGQSFWQLNDGGSDFNTNIPFTANTLIQFAFTFNGGQSYSILITEGANTYSGPNFNASGAINSIDGVKMFSSQQGAGENFGFNNLAIVPEPSPVSLLIGSALLGACYFRMRRRVAA